MRCKHARAALVQATSSGPATSGGTATLSAEVRAHLAACPACAAEWAALREADALLASLTPAPVPDDAFFAQLEARVAQAVATTPGPAARPAWASAPRLAWASAPRLAWGGGVAALLLAVGLWVSGQAPDPTARPVPRPAGEQIAAAPLAPAPAAPEATAPAPTRAVAPPPVARTAEPAPAVATAKAPRTTPRSTAPRRTAPRRVTPHRADTRVARAPRTAPRRAATAPPPVRIAAVPPADLLPAPAPMAIMAAPPAPAPAAPGGPVAMMAPGAARLAPAPGVGLAPTAIASAPVADGLPTAPVADLPAVEDLGQTLLVAAPLPPALDPTAPDTTWAVQPAVALITQLPPPGERTE